MLNRIQRKRRFISFKDIEKILQSRIYGVDIFLKNGKKIHIMVVTYDNFNKIRIAHKDFNHKYLLG